MVTPPAARTLADVVLRSFSTGYTGPPAARPWLPPLRHPTAINNLLNQHQPKHLSIPVGIVDLPFQLTQKPWTITLDGVTFSAAIGGGPKMGKSTFMQTLVMSTAYTHDPHEVAIFAIDFSGGKLVQLEALPHVTSVATQSDVARINRILNELTAIGHRRQETINTHRLGSWERYRQLRHDDPTHPAAADPYGDILFILDGWDNFNSASWVPTHIKDGHEQFTAALATILRNGPNQGIHSIIGCTRWADLRSKYKDYLPLKIDLKPADIHDTGLDIRAVRDIPNIAGRAMSNDAHAIAYDGTEHTHQHIMLAAPRLDGKDTIDDIDATTQTTIDIITERWNNSTQHPPKLQILPTNIAITDLLAKHPTGPRDEHTTRWTIPIGLAESTIEPLHTNMAETPNLLIFGAGKSGKTTAIRAAAEAITSQNSPEQVRFVVISYNGKLYNVVDEQYMLPELGEGGRTFIRNPDELATTIDRLLQVLPSRRIPPEMSPDQVRQRDWWVTPYELVILIDDWHMVHPTIQHRLDNLSGLNEYIQTPETGVHLIATCLSAQMQTLTYSGRSPVVAAWNMGTPTLALSGSAEDYPTKAFTITKRPPGQATYICDKTQEDIIQIGQTAQ